MADERLRTLERQAETGDPDARAAWLKELERTGDPRAVAVRERETRLQERLDSLRAAVDGLIDLEVAALEPGARGRCRGMSVVLLRGVVRAALQSEDDYGFGFKTLSRTWPTGRSNWDQIDEFEQLDDPYVVMAFAGRLDDELVLRVAISSSRKPTPGTTWNELSPWRTNLTSKTWRKRLRSWLDTENRLSYMGAEDTPERMSVAEARLWIELTDLEAADAPAAEPQRRVVNLDAPSEKQLKFIKSLKRKKHLTEAELSEVLRAQAGVKLLDYLGRQDASKVIDALLALPDPPKGAKRPKEPAAAKKAAAKKAPAKKTTSEKVSWQGRVLAVQPRIKMTRMRGEEQHGYQGFALRLEGTVGDEARAFSVGIGKAAQAKHEFQAGDTVSGAAVPVPATAHEATDYYKASKLKLEAREPQEGGEPPWLGPPPELPTYRQRGHRALGEDSYAAAPCSTCLWACLMPVEDREGDDPARALETHCYGPKDCSAYQPF